MIEYSAFVSAPKRGRPRKAGAKTHTGTTPWVHPALRECQQIETALKSDNGKRRDEIRARVASKYATGPRVPSGKLPWEKKIEPTVPDGNQAS